MQNISKRRSRFCEFSNLVPRGVVTSCNHKQRQSQCHFLFSEPFLFVYNNSFNFILFVARRRNFVQIVEPIFNCNTDFTQAIYIDFLFIDLGVML